MLKKALSSDNYIIIFIFYIIIFYILNSIFPNLFSYSFLLNKPPFHILNKQIVVTRFSKRFRIANFKQCLFQKRCYHAAHIT